METVIRKPFQGVLNVVRFNWHFYVIAFLFTLFLFTCTMICANNLKFILVLTSFLILIPTIISLFVTYYIYDYSKIYDLEFVNNLKIKPKTKLVNINAGFDEFSFIILDKFKNEKLNVFDFYNPEKHTEISIERARKTTQIYPNTIQINTSKIHLEDNSVDFVFLLFAAHEIRNSAERITFFKQINLKLKPNGKVIVLEHLRDFPNFLAYTIGFFHFISKNEWTKTFHNSNFEIENEIKITPFLSLFTLQKNGVTS